MHPVDIVGFGASSVDYVNVLPELPSSAKPNAKLRIASHFIACGGQVATALAACAALGLRTRYLGPLGTDGNAARIRAELERRGVDVSRAIVRSGPNQFAVILVEEHSGERIVLWHRDPALAVQPRDIDPEAIRSARILHVDDADPEGAIAAARVAGASGVVVTTDIDRVTERTPALVECVTIPIFAEHVPAALTGETDLERALRKLRREHHRLLCVTLGRRGAVALDGDRLLHAPAHEVRAVDSTAAGDVFRAGFVHAFLAGKSSQEMLAWGNAAAAVSCTRRGAIDSVPTLKEVQATLRHVDMRPGYSRA